MYSGATSVVRDGALTSDSFPIRRGVAQGCVLSPLLFAIYVDGLLDQLQEALDAQQLNLPANALAFADDLVLLARSPEHLRLLLRIVENWCTDSSMQISVSKTKVMPIGPNAQQDISIAVDHDILQVVQRYKYLGYLVHSTGDWSENTRHRATRGKQLIAANASFLTNNEINFDLRLTAGRTLVLSSTKYGDEWMNIPPSLQRQLESVQTSLNRTTLRLPYTTKAAAMRFLTGVSTLAFQASEAKTRFAKRMSKLWPDRLVRQAHDARPKLALMAKDSTREELRLSHCSAVLEICDGLPHLLLSKYGVAPECLFQWTVSSTDTWEDIQHLNLDSTALCRLCKLEPETKHHLLIACGVTSPQRIALIKEMPKSHADEFRSLPEKQALWYLLGGLRPPFNRATQPRTQLGCSITAKGGTVDFHQQHPEDRYLRLCLTTQAKEDLLTVAVSCKTRQGVLLTRSYRVEGKDHQIPLRAALASVLEEIFASDRYESYPIQVLTSSRPFALFLSKPRPDSQRRCWTDRLLYQLSRIPAESRLHSHFVSDKAMAAYCNHKLLHSRAKVLLESEESLRYRVLLHYDLVARYCLQVSRLLPERPELQEFRSFRR